MTDSMGPGKLVRHMQNLSYTYDEYLICIGLGPSILSVICKNLSYSGPSYPSSPVLSCTINWLKNKERIHKTPEEELLVQFWLTFSPLNLYWKERGVSTPTWAGVSKFKSSGSTGDLSRSTESSVRQIVHPFVISWHYNVSPIQGLSQQGVRVSFWHPGPRKIPILGGKDTLSFDQNSLKILITSRYSKKFNS